MGTTSLPAFSCSSSSSSSSSIFWALAPSGFDDEDDDDDDSRGRRAHLREPQFAAAALGVVENQSAPVARLPHDLVQNGHGQPNGADRNTSAE